MSALPVVAPPPYVPYKIEGQVVLITGASAGIGEACAWRFAAEGSKLVLLARRADRLEALRSALLSVYPSLHVALVVMDVREWGRVEKLIEELPEDFKAVDVLVNNAGLALGLAPGHEYDMEDARVMIDTNVTSVMYFTKALVPGMVERGRGHVINISSIAGTETYPGGSIYCASKHAIHAFTNAMRHDLVHTPVRVTSISPGLVKTEFSLVRFKGDADKAEAPYQGLEPLKAEDIADQVIFAATRPPHVQVADILCFASNQASVKNVARPLANS